MDPDAFEACFRRWMAGMAIASNGKHIAIDGKTLRRSFEAAEARPFTWSPPGCSRTTPCWGKSSQ